MLQSVQNKTIRRILIGMIWFIGPPVGVGMNIDIASIDMVSEVNMVSVIIMLPCLRHIFVTLFPISSLFQVSYVSFEKL